MKRAPVTTGYGAAIRDGFEYRARHDMPVLREFMLRHLDGADSSTAPGALATALARALKRYRPELDLYLLTDRAIGSACAKYAALLKDGSALSRTCELLEDLGPDTRS